MCGVTCICQGQSGKQRKLIWEIGLKVIGGLTSQKLICRFFDKYSENTAASRYMRADEREEDGLLRRQELRAVGAGIGTLTLQRGDAACQLLSFRSLEAGTHRSEFLSCKEGGCQAPPEECKQTLKK